MDNSDTQVQVEFTEFTWRWGKIDDKFSSYTRKIIYHELHADVYKKCQSHTKFIIGKQSRIDNRTKDELNKAYLSGKCGECYVTETFPPVIGPFFETYSVGGDGGTDFKYKFGSIDNKNTQNINSTTVNITIIRNGNPVELNSDIFTFTKNSKTAYKNGIFVGFCTLKFLLNYIEKYKYDPTRIGSTIHGNKWAIIPIWELRTPEEFSEIYNSGIDYIEDKYNEPYNITHLNNIKMENSQTSVNDEVKLIREQVSNIEAKIDEMQKQYLLSIKELIQRYTGIIEPTPEAKKTRTKPSNVTPMLPVIHDTDDFNISELDENKRNLLYFIRAKFYKNTDRVFGIGLLGSYERDLGISYTRIKKLTHDLSKLGYLERIDSRANYRIIGKKGNI